MAKRQHTRRKRYHRGRAILYKILSVIVVSFAIVAALTMFFKVDQVTVSGTTRYAGEEVIKASDVKSGDNLFLLNKYEIQDAIKKQLPYVSSVRISRKLPDTLLIEVADSQVGGVIQEGGNFWVISADDGRILDCRKDAGEAAVIRGLKPVSPAVGKPLKAAKDEGRKLEQLQALLGALEEKGMLQGAKSIDVSKDTMITLGYTDRFTVELAYGADYLYKLSNLNQVIEQLEDNERGTIDLTYDGRANFIPG